MLNISNRSVAALSACLVVLAIPGASAPDSSGRAEYRAVDRCIPITRVARRSLTP